ncbi:MAG: baseplate J/gp47 family protein [Peptostreptococcaceae bacterium]|nr:baseplate J/gp47 family protein [Peptostreptococcaceae bacterium]
MSKTYEEIKQRVLNNTDIDVDKREGSFLNNMASPLSYELAKFYIEQQDLVNMAFVKNGYFNYLDAKCEEYGISRKQGTKAVGEVIFTGENGTLISNGTMLFVDDLYFIVLNDAIIAENQAELVVEALEVGKQYNLLANTKLTLTEPINGVTDIYVKSNFENGTDIESDEDLRERFFTTIKKSYTSGNVAHYETWTLEVNGTGACKVYPLKNGNGTVEIVITNSDMLGASSELIESVKANIEEKRPIGASVTVVSATEKAINVSATVRLARGYSQSEVETLFKEKLTQYLKEIAFKDTYVSTARLGNLLLDTTGVFDYADFRVNGAMNNVELLDTDVPKVGEISFSYVEVV